MKGKYGPAKKKKHQSVARRSKGFIKLLSVLLYSEEDYVDEDEDDMNCTKNEDELERAEMRLLQRQLEDLPAETQEEKDYKEEFFELLDEVYSAKRQN